MGKCKCGKEIEDKFKQCYPCLQNSKKAPLEHGAEVEKIMGTSNETKIHRQAMAKVAAVLVASANAKEEKKISVLELAKTTEEVTRNLVKFINE